MRIAFLGWGSLYWNPGTLRVSGNWQSGGPRLPVEFARISRNGRPSLVIYEAYPDGRKTGDPQVLWIEAADTDPDEARRNLAYRENPDLAGHESDPDFPERLARTVGLVLVGEPDSSDKYIDRIKNWGKQKGLDGVVWTALRSNWDDGDHPPPEPFRSLALQPFSCENLKKYLKQLKQKQSDISIDSATREKYTNALTEAEKYIRLAPPQIDTPCRKALERDPGFNWLRFTPAGITSAADETPAAHSAAPETLALEAPPNPPGSSTTPVQPTSSERLRRRVLQLVANLSPMFAGTWAGDREEPVATLTFSAEFRRASNRFKFLMDEGHPYHVSDQIFDDIEASGDLLKSGANPAKEDRAKLTKAYRDLVTISQTSVTFDGMPPMPFWSTRSPWLWLFLLIGVVPSIVLMVKTQRQYWYVPAAYIIIIAALFWGLYIFTGVITNSKLNQIIRYCYVFTGFALAISILPWSPWSVPLFSGLSKAAPLGVLRGCAVKPAKAVTSTTGIGIPGEVLCEEGNYQWVINIGGVIDPAGEKMLAAGAASQNDLGAHIRGGVVVPLYVIVLALFGSAVSMTRRVPEYQRRAMDSQDSLSNVQARENLVFQIMQVLSAPLIAITVYYMVKPDTPLTSVVLGFGSGFASEPILLMIRSLVEKLSPAQAAGPNTNPITVRVDPSTVTLKPGEPKQFSAKVFGSPNSEVSWQIDPPDP